MVWGAVTARGSSCLGVPLLLQQERGHGMGWEDWQSNGIPAFTAPMSLLKFFICTKTARLSSLNSGNSCHQIKGAEGMEQHLCYGAGGGKETPVLGDALVGQGDESWQRAGVPLHHRTPQLPMHEGHSDHPKGISFPAALLPACCLNLGIKLPQTPNAKALPKPH